MMKKITLCLLLTTSFILYGCNAEKIPESSEKNVVEQQAEEKSSVGSKKENIKQTIEPAKQFNRAAKILFKNRAVSASLFGIPESISGYHYASTLEDYSPQAEAIFRQQMRDLSKSLLSLNTKEGSVTEENVSVMVDIVSYYAGEKNNPVGFIDSWMGHSAFILNQINGPMIDIPNNLANSHTIKNSSDAKDYLQRLKLFQSLAANILLKAKSDESAGWIPPQILISKTHAYLKGFTQVDATQSLLITSFRKKLSAVDDLSEEDRQLLLVEAEKIVQNTVYPAFQSLESYTEKLIDKGRSEAGIWAQPGGSEFYKYSIKRLGDTNLNPDQIHQLGLDEVERISSQMDTILRQQGYAEGTVGERMVALNQQQRFLYENNDSGRAQLLADLNSMIDEISTRMPEYFESIPPYKVEVKRIPIATQDTSAGGYYTPPTMDGTVPGIYWINLKNTEANAKFDLKTLTYHEAIPGHHWQVALNLAQDELPLLRRIAPYNAYVEGWALYSEQVAAEMGLYKDDPFSDLGRLKAELFRAVRLVVDTGLHHKKWSREQAIDYMAATTGTEIGDVTSEIERYMAWPGQALGYKLGMLKILELRELAIRQLGEKFDIKQFHDVILLGGAVPMNILQSKIEKWIKGSQ